MSPAPSHSFLHLSALTGADPPSVDSLIEAIRSEEPGDRTEAWLAAGEVGASAVRPLADLVSQGDREVARAAQRGIWRIVRHASRPGAEEERGAVAAELVQILESQPGYVLLRVVLWMLSEIGADEAIDSIASFLNKPDSREDARMALERIPGEKSLASLKAGLEEAPDDFKSAIAQSLRVRGVQVSRYPSAKLVPTKTTQVQALKEEASDESDRIRKKEQKP